MDLIAIFLHYINENAILCFLIIIAYFFINRNLSFLLFVSLGIVSVIVEVLKLVVSKPRPFFVENIVPIVIENEPYKSFPSGHVASLSIILFVICFYNRKLIIPSIVFLSLMAYTRVYLRLHYPIDMLFSILISAVVAVVMIFLYEKFVSKKFPIKK